MNLEVSSRKMEVRSTNCDERNTSDEVKKWKLIKSVTTYFIPNENLCFFVKTVPINDTSKKYT